MFYKFSQITQAVSSTTQQSSMGQFISQKAVEPSNIQYEYATKSPSASKPAEPVQQTGLRQYPVPNNPKYRKLMDMQTKFTHQDGLLVWQKLPKDMPLYYTSIALVSVGFGLTVYSLIKLATPPKNN